jgi:hypothetical protein
MHVNIACKSLKNPWAFSFHLSNVLPFYFFRLFSAVSIHFLLINRIQSLRLSLNMSLWFDWQIKNYQETYDVQVKVHGPRNKNE